MSTLVVVENPARWPLDIPGIDLVAAQDYLTDPHYSTLRGVKVFNLCRKLGYQTTGYYVSLLAAARGHRPLPSVATVQDLRLGPAVSAFSAELDDLIERSLGPLKRGEFVLSIYFGRNMAHRYDPLCRSLFNQFPSPLLRAQFVRERRWRLRSIRPIAASEIPETHREFVAEAAQAHFARPSSAPARRRDFRYDLAILVDPDAEDAPSDPVALRHFVRAARRLGLDARFIGKDDYGKLAAFDALFIRETTAVNHHTYRFARRAAAEGLVVLDDPRSIVRCSNKVYQAELFAQRNVATPRTLLVHAGNVDEVTAEVGLPCVLKRPDAAFSRGVVRADTEDELHARLADFLEESELAIAQEFLPSGFDWRVGVLGGDVLFCCKYHMVRGHWQIARSDRRGRRRYGRVEPVALDEAPPRVLATARKATRPIGDGLYGVDLKEVGRRVVVVEVNDNPNIDAGCEDAIAREGLYEAVMRYFLERLEARGARNRA